MTIREMIARKSVGASSSPIFSFEFFPPKTAKGEESLYRTVDELKALKPDFVSVTYGAGGATRVKTVEWVDKIQNEHGVTAMAHLTCVGASRDELARVLDDLAARGISNVLALRGDPPKGQDRFQPAADGFAFANELVEFVRGRHPEFSIGVAGYPEKHPEAADLETDLARLAAKVEAGGDFVVTQLFFDNDRYFNFVDGFRRLLADRPACFVIPGVMPITSRDQLDRFVAMCGTFIPPLLREEILSAPDDETVVEIGVRYAIAQCRDLLARGAPGVHFYTLNKSLATRRIMEALRG